MFTCDFSKRGAASLCDFLIESVITRIMDGSLKAHEKLPSKRSLAAHLGVSVITVQNAYAELISRGYLYSIEKKGFFVTDLPLPEKRTMQNGKRQKAKEDREQKKSSGRIFFADLESNATGYKKFPFSVWSKLTKSVLQSPHETLLKKQPPQGSLALRESIAGYLKSFRNMDVSPEQIVIGAGTEVLYSCIVHLLGSSLTFAVENPGYKKIAQMLALNGARVIHIPIDENGLNVKTLSGTEAEAVHVTPNHHFPTGIVMPIKRRMELLSWAEEKKESRYIIEDDYDSEFRLEGKPMPPLQCASPDLNIIYMNTFSKTLSPSFRIGYMVLPRKLVRPFTEKFGFCSCTVSAFEQHILASFIHGGFYAKHIIRMKNYYRNLRNELVFRIEKMNIGSVIQIHEEHSGLHFLITVRSAFSGKKLKARLEKNGIKIALLSEFFYGEQKKTEFISSAGTAIPADKTFIVNYSGIDRQNIPGTAERIFKSVRQEYAPAAF
ncbi:MAG: PLP-dependent aminotransferase family protein [Treponema sp.]|nr:PLP-dependent aminotransferase family protein [Treponema sp.]